ncbi:hypothetical protein [Streptomyces sp. NPDC020917]|uniref:hypothetical protein n=1 Tax=Streptomyces sp. NPDC020917 TaxID=3365102 RepID=UPI0037B89320
MSRLERGLGCVTAVFAVPLAIVLALVGVGSLISSSHRHSARRDLDRRAHRYADALAESYAQGRKDESDFRTLAATVGGGRLGMVSAIPAATSTVVGFEGDERYSTPGNGWGASAVVCYRVTLGPSMPHPVQLDTVTC